MIKIFSYKDGSDLELMVNKWLGTNTNIKKIIDIKYQVYTYDHELWHSALVLYE